MPYGFSYSVLPRIAWALMFELMMHFRGRKRIEP